MRKLEDAARALLAKYDCLMSRLGNDHRNAIFPCEDDWPELRALRAALAEQEAAPPRELSEEGTRAMCESAEYEAEEKHFAARPQIDFIAYRTPFRAGFERGWDAARAIERKAREE